MGLMGELSGTDVGSSILSQIWADTGGQLPTAQIPEITGDPIEGISNEELTRMLNRSDLQLLWNRALLLQKRRQKSRLL